MKAPGVTPATTTDLLDVSDSPPADGASLVYDETTGMWAPSAAAAEVAPITGDPGPYRGGGVVPTTIYDLLDVELPENEPEEGSTLVFDTATGKYVITAP